MLLAFLLLSLTYYSISSKKNNEAFSVLKSCPEKVNTSLSTCYSKYIIDFAANNSYQNAITRLSLDKSNPELAKICHFAAHSLGKDAFYHYKNVSKAILAGGLSCSNGYYHGILEAAGSSLSAGEFARNINSFCAPLLKQPINHMDCSHGIGHATYLNAKFDLSNAIILCSSLIASLDRLMCSSGVFMQWGVDFRANLIQPREPNKIRELCLVANPRYPAEYETACLENILLALTIEDFNNYYSFSKFREWCNKLGNEKDKVACYYGIGYAANGLLNFDSKKLTSQVCGAMLKLENQKCIHRMSQGFGAVLGLGKMRSDICKLLTTDQQLYCLNVKEYELR